MITRQLKMMFKMMLGGYGCKDTERLLYQFVEGELDDKSRRKLESHLRDCPECLEFVRTYRQTIKLAGEHGIARETDMPPDLVKKLRDFIANHPDLD
jgi:anti-sigma factor RsiW